MTALFPRAAWGGLLALALGGLALAGCGRRPAPHDGPVIVITLEGLRADVVGALGGEPGLTPHLDRLIRDSDWAGRAVAPSSATAPALASLWTGLRPWQHQVLHPGRAALPASFPTLSTALHAAGYRAWGYHSGPWLKARFGYARGFDAYRELARGWAARARLARLSGGRELVWIHLPEPAPPLVRRDRYLPRVPGASARLPARITRAELAPFADPAVRLPPWRRRAVWALYRLNVAWADERLGDLLAAVHASGQWDRALVAVISVHGEEFEERGQVLEGGNLGRPLIEVPLAVKLPAGFGREIAVAAGERPGTARLWATLVEAVGGTVPPAAAPSLFRRAPAGALSELYLGDGANQFSWVEGDHQLLWESRFAPPAPGWYRARFDPRSPVRRALLAAFARTPPLSGSGAPGLTLQVWEGNRGSRPAADPSHEERTAAMAGRLAAAWTEFLPEGETPPAAAPNP